MADCAQFTPENDPFESVTESFSSAQKFVDRLIELQDEWEEDGGWIFRGQNCSEWELIPALHRVWRREYGTWYEFLLVDNFIENANMVKLDIPSNTINYAKHIREFQHATTRFPRDDDKGNGLQYDFTHAVFAIAQHSGVPTRLLDFTYSALVAAFFAFETSSLRQDLGLSEEKLAGYFEEVAELVDDCPEQALEMLQNRKKACETAESKLPEKMAVWALKLNTLPRRTNLRYLNHSHTEILNLRAQEGVFVFHKGLVEKEVDENARWPSFKDEVLKLVETSSVLKLTLPFSEGDHLWGILRKKKMGYMYLAPTYELIAQRSRETVDNFIIAKQRGVEAEEQ